MVTASLDRVAVSVPCARRLRIGERAVLYRDAIYCTDCMRMVPVLGPRPVEFTLERGATCGGGHPLD